MLKHFPLSPPYYYLYFIAIIFIYIIILNVRFIRALSRATLVIVGVIVDGGGGSLPTKTTRNFKNFVLWSVFSVYL